MTTQKSYYRVMLGQDHKYADKCYQGEFIGGQDDGGFGFDLSNHLEDPDSFKKEFRDRYIEHNPDKEHDAGRACGAVWTICKGIEEGDIVLCPNRKGKYWVGEVISGYLYQSECFFPHQRKVAWFSEIARADMSLKLKGSTGSQHPYVNLTEKYAKEIERLISGESQPQLTTSDESIEDASEFALEKHLEDFLVQNWKSTELGQKYDIIEQQYKTDTGFIDILAVSNDKKELLVIELKKGHASNKVAGQILTYMGYIQAELANKSGQKVRGAIIAFEDDKRLKHARSAAGNIDFYEYKVNFSLSKK